ncbi:hypothetical protein EZV62_008952 [Acer yangbiense]|uniref:Disease resistance R13L4/SHOC-2-like LRR domain-containing protein n=1 Tax=Acer yangbiense TaxID=1000413 RepID=A0A5C7IEC5_9ROSI|nr:hypothetical protein EZV62_008952 [Acer yangbiense]
MTVDRYWCLCLPSIYNHLSVLVNSYRKVGWLMWCYQLLCLQLVLLHSLSFANLCSHEQSSALLQFKQHFSLSNSSSTTCDFVGIPSYPKMKYWKEDIDCCSWDGVTCDRVTGQVIGLDLSCSWLYGSIPSNSSLFLLSCQKLNLAFNDFFPSQIPSDFVRFQSLTHLNLTFSIFSGQVLIQISHLPNLISLALGDLQPWPRGLTLETLVMKGIIQNLTKLEELILDGVNMSPLAPGHLTNLTSSLMLLSLGNCGLQGSFPENIFHLPNLHTLKLQGNQYLKCNFSKVDGSSSLRYLDVSYTSFSEKLPNTIGNLKHLSHLDMEKCNFIGPVPMSIGNLTQLSYLDLSDNNLSGHIPSSLSNLEQLIRFVKQ